MKDEKEKTNEVPTWEELKQMAKDSWEQMKETDRRMQETDRQMQETDRRMQIGRASCRERVSVGV